MARSFRSPLTKVLRDAASLEVESRERGMPLEEAAGERAERTLTRRELIGEGAGAAFALSAIPFVRAARAVVPATPPRVVIVGSGLAGLSCARMLWEEHHVAAHVYEWDDRIGGRCETLRGFFEKGQVVEQHGEFISSEHTRMRALARHFGLSMDNTDIVPHGVEDTYRFDGEPISAEKLARVWREWGWRLFHDSAARAPFPTRYNDHPNATALAWDRMSVPEWIERYVPGGLNDWFGQLLIQDVLDEYGGDPADQSALNLVYVLGYDDSSGSGNQPRSGPVLSGTDEKYHVREGSDRIVFGMQSELPNGTITTSQRLVALRKKAGGTYVCTFESGARTYDVVADHVVLALPFATLRNVDLSGADVPQLKMYAIHHQGMGSNSKVQLQFDREVWVSRGSTGNFFTDDGAQSGWPAPGMGAESTVLVDYLGGSAGLDLGRRFGLTTDEGPAPAPMVRETLAKLEKMFPGIAAAWNGKGYYNWSPGDEHILGAYSYYRVGQYSGFSGIEPLPVGNLHFAGEHTSLDFQGYMEGAVRSGERAAREVAMSI